MNDGIKSIGKCDPEKIKQLQANMWHDDTIFPERLEIALRNRGLTNSYLFKAGVMSNGTVYNYRTYGRSPTGYTIQKICSAIGCSSDFLLGLKEEDDEF